MRDNPMVDAVNTVPGTRSLGAVMGELARTLQREHASEHDTREAVVTAAVQAVPGAENAAIILVLGRKTVQSHTATSPRARRMDELQTELQDGPCLTAIWEQETVRTSPTWPPSHWPRFAAAAVEAGVGAMLCFQLFVHGDDDHPKVIQIVGQLVEDASVDTGIDGPGQSDCQRPLPYRSPLRFRQ